jgi:hypothetical protein
MILPFGIRAVRDVQSFTAFFVLANELAIVKLSLATVFLNRIDDPQSHVHDPDCVSRDR